MPRPKKQGFKEKLDTALAPALAAKPKLTTEAKLHKIAVRRVPACIKAIQLVGAIANYKPTPDQKQAILKAIKKAVADLEWRFESTGSKTGIAFTLPGAE